MWIMLIKKLPTNPSPPKMSIFWSIPWPDVKVIERQRMQLTDPLKRQRSYCDIPKTLTVREEKGLTGDIYFNYFGFQEPQWNGARKINYKGEQIRVFPHEFSELTLENLKMYLEDSHELIPGTVAEEDIMDSVLRGNKRRIYDAALVDGCTEYEARLMAMGVDVADGHYEIPAIGWYRIRPEYGHVFCYEREMEE